MFSSLSMWSYENLPAAPPGSPLALPLIYSLIHLCCCHMASLLPPILSLPPPSHISELLISGASPSRYAPLPSPRMSTFIPSTPSPSLLSPPSAPPLSCNRAPCLFLQCCSSLPRSAQIRSCHRQRLMYPWATRWGPVSCKRDPLRWGKGGSEEHTFPFSNHRPTSVFIFMVV